MESHPRSIVSLWPSVEKKNVDENQPMFSMKNQPQPEGLSKRSSEILGLLAKGLSDREIAERLVLTLNTVKWYNRQIYSVLGVESRTQAVARARELQLLHQSNPLELATPTLPRPPQDALPAETTPFIGRRYEIEAVKHQLASARLVTLTGTPGTGKTRLALRVAQEVAVSFPNGGYFIPLASLSDPELVLNSIANALGVNDTADRALILALKQSLRESQILLVLDNFEHLLPAAPQISELLAAAPLLKILATSREPLHLYGEQRYPVPPLALPDHTHLNPQGLASCESIALFLQHARAMKPDFAMTDENALEIAQICVRLEGLPLAIELAAARIKFLNPRTLLARLSSRLDTLTGGAHDLPVRQRTLRNTIEWSYNLLHEGEKTLFARLAIFHGGCSLEAIEIVCGETLGMNVFDGLESLVDKNLVQQKETTNGEPRFAMLETIREYALEQLGASGTTDLMRKRHTRYFADLTTHAQRFLRQAGYAYWFSVLTLEQDNLRAALDGSLSGNNPEFGLRMVAALQDFWFYEGYHNEGVRWTELALRRLSEAEPSLQVGVLTTAGMLSYARQEPEPGLRYYEQALAVAHQLENPQALAWSLIFVAHSMCHTSNRTEQSDETAVAMCEEGVSIFRATGNLVGLAQGLNMLGNIHSIRGHLLLAHAAYQACLHVCRETGERRREMLMLANLSTVAVNLGNFVDARKLTCQFLQLSREIGFTYMTVLELGRAIPATLVSMGRLEQAARLLGASAALQDSMNIRQQPTNLPDVERTEARVRQQMEETEFRLAYEGGHSMSLEEAISFAIKIISPPRLDSYDECASGDNG